MMDKLVIKRPKPKTSRKTGRGEVIRITDEAYEILSGLSAESGKTVSFLASNMIQFASEHVVIEDE